MSKIKGNGFGVRFYKRPGAKQAMTTDKTTKGKDTPPQEITEPFPRREMQPVIDVPDQIMHMELFESWPPQNAATRLADEIKKAKQALQKPIEQKLELMPQEVAAKKQTFQKPPALQAAMKKAEEKKKARGVDITKESQLWAAAQVGDCAKIRMLVMAGVDLEMRDSYKRTALNIAMQYNQKDAIKTIMAAKEMRKMVERNELPPTHFFVKHKKEKTGT